MPTFLTPELQVLVWSMVVFFTVLGLLWRFAWGPIMHALEEREARIQKNIDDANDRSKQAEAKLVEYEQRLQAAREESAALLAEARRMAEQMRESLIGDAQKESAAVLERGKREIELAKDGAVAELKGQVVQLTADLAAKIIAREVKPEDHQRFISDAVAHMGAEKN